MKKITLLILLSLSAFASINEVTSFDADFIQNITDEKNKVLTYKGHITASRPQNAFWKYTTPIEKNVYITSFEVIIVEPELEQVIVRKVSNDFDFFKMIKNAKKVKKDMYRANYKETMFTIATKGDLIISISYLDEFENIVKIKFLNQKQNIKIDNKIFRADFPLDYDIIRD